MLSKNEVETLRNLGRDFSKARTGDSDLGPFSQLPGKWVSLPGRGWNMIALPFAQGEFNYRLLVNQYNEELNFEFVDKAVPNRGIDLTGSGLQTDQLVVTLDYTQSITQIAADDMPDSGIAGPRGLKIHHEPGLFLHMTNEAMPGADIARLATIPHGNSVLALGTFDAFSGPPTIPEISGLPIGVNPDLDNPYLQPYSHYHNNLFRELFDPVHPNALLQAALDGVKVNKTVALSFDSEVETAGISNIPFVARQADASSLQSTFWIEELDEVDAFGEPVLQLQYSQTVMLDFFPRPDGKPGSIKWPHVSINTLRKVSSQ